MTRKVRIVRKSVPFRDALMRVLKVVNVGLRIHVKHVKQYQTDLITQARLAKMATDREVAEMRREYMVNQTVLQDLKIQEKRRELGLDDEAAIRRVDERADWRRP